MGHELFDKAFKEYAQRWMFKSPTPADFFRTMEDASAVDLDWFWKAWFYTIDNVDISMDEVTIYHVGSESETGDKPKYSSRKPNPDYNVKEISRKNFDKYYATSFENIADFHIEDYYYVKINFSNKGGIVMPLIVKLEFED